MATYKEMLASMKVRIPSTKPAHKVKVRPVSDKELDKLLADIDALFRDLQ